MARSGAWVAALGVALVMQTTNSALTRVFPVIGPVLTEAAGVPSESIGVLASAGSLGTMWYLVAGGEFLPRFGPVRLLQVGAAVGALGVAVATLGGWWALLAASLLIGLGYGPSPPAGSEILKRHAPARHRSLVFSIKQSGVPLGGAVAGLLVPAVLLAAGWRAACFSAVLFALATAVAVQPWRAAIDGERDARRPLSLRTFLDPRALAIPFRTLGRDRALLATTYASICFAVAQGSVFAYLVTYLTVHLGLGLAAAGFAFATLQMAGVVGRVLVGWLADRVGSARLTLIVLAVASAAATALLATVGPSWPSAGLLGLSAAAGVAVASWNGVFLAVVSSLVPDRAVGEATAAATFFTFFGYVVGPIAFGSVLAWGGSYEAAFGLIALAPLTGALALAGAAASSPTPLAGAG